MKISRRLLSLILVTTLGSSAIAEEPKTMVLEGDLSSFYAGGDFVVWTRKPIEEQAAGSSMSMVATSTSTSASSKEEPPPFESTHNVIAKVPLAEDGTFRIEVPVEQPWIVNFNVFNAIGLEGQRWGSGQGPKLRARTRQPSHHPE